MDVEETKNHMKETRYLIALLLLILLAGLIYLASDQRMPALIPGEKNSLAEQIRTGEAPIPVYTEKTAAKLATSKGFQAISSYTAQGFEPREISIKVRETVRFVNNSSDQLWVASQGGNVSVYPRTYNACGNSDLDSCGPFPPQDFWEFTFEVKGDWRVVNNLDKQKSTIVRVR